MLKIQEKVSKVLEELKKQNPDANWANLFTGIAILVMLAVFSIWYFSNSNTVNLEQSEQLVTKDQDESDNGIVVENEPESKEVKSTNEATVKEGEGLWQVAERVCGDGEKYVALALANGLDEWSELYAGQVLKVSCE